MALIIERVEVFGVALPLVKAFSNARGAKTVQKSVIVRLTAASGVVGIGNVDPVPGSYIETAEESIRVLEERLARAVVGCDALNVNRLLPLLDSLSPPDSDARVAIEMACVDLAARAFGVPVHAYLGGAVIDRVEFNAWIGVASPEDAAAEAQGWFRKGFRSAKIKVGKGVQADVACVTAVREAVGPEMALRIDANESYDAETSISLARSLAPLDIQLFEQPAPRRDLEGLARVRSKGGIPVMADESVWDHASLLAVIGAGAADIVKFKMMKQGGFYRTLRMMATAEAAGLRCVIGHGFGMSVSTMAEIMLASTSHNVLPGLECVGPLKTNDYISTQPVDLSRGALAVPQGSGLGVMLDEEKLLRYAMRKQ